MSKLKEIILSTVLSASVLLTGCETVTSYFKDHAYKTLSTTATIREPIYNIQTMSYADIGIPAQRGDLQKQANDIVNFLDFVEKYEPQTKQLKDYLDSSQKIGIDAVVKNLASQLEQDQTPFARNYLEKIRNFSYEAIKIEETMTQIKIKDKRLDPTLYTDRSIKKTGLLNWVFPFDILFFGPFDALYHLIMPGRKTLMTNRITQKVRYWPYQGREDVVVNLKTEIIDYDKGMIYDSERGTWQKMQ